MNKTITLIILLLFIACTDQQYVQIKYSEEIWNEIQSNDYLSVDFSKFGGNEWKRVCFLGPYNLNSKEALGFDWDISKHTDVLTSDGHNVIIFTTETRVIDYIVHSRAKGDFWKLSGKCIPREFSKLVRDKKIDSSLNYVQKSKA